MDIILGSGSPRRKFILEELFGEVKIFSPSVDETLFENETASQYTERVTNLKMDAVLSGIILPESYCVITSDTIVSIDGKILGKPVSEEDAFSMLNMLSNREHAVITGLCLVLKNNGSQIRFYDNESTLVKFKILDDQIIKHYLGIINYSDKAGSYAIQEHGELIVDSISGSMTNIIGFPLRLFFKMINSSGLTESVF